MDELKEIYRANKTMFEKRLRSFKKVWTQGSDIKIFEEFCYCLCTPREKAKNALNAVSALSKNNLLIDGDYTKIDKVLFENKIALHPAKAERIVKNRKIFYPNTKHVLQSKYCFANIKQAREELARDVDGFGFKEASHFLRNIGFGGNLAIIDRHVKNQLAKYGIIAESNANSANITKKHYGEIEEKMRQFAHDIKIPLDILDMLLIYSENREIIK